MLDGSGVVHVAQYLMGESRLQFPACLVELLKLHGGEVVKVITVRTHEMGEYRTRDDGILTFQTCDDLINIFLGVEAQAVHTSIQFDMYWQAGDTLFLCRTNQSIHQSEGIHLRFQVIVEHGLESSHLRVHDHDILSDAMTTERHTLISHRHGEIVDTMVLQCLRHLDGTGTIGIRLHHAHQLRLWLEERAVEVQVIDHGIQVDFQYRLMNFLFQELREMVETEDTCPLQENHLIMQTAEQRTVHKLLDAWEESLVGYGNHISLRLDSRTDTYQAVDTPFLTEVADLPVEFRLIHTRLLDITQYQRTSTTLILWATIHKVESDIQRVDIRIIGVVDECASMLSLFDLQTHGDRFQLRHPHIQVIGCHTQVEGDGSTGNGAFHGSLINKGKAILPPGAFIAVGYSSGTRSTRSTRNTRDIQRCRRILPTPPYLLTLITRATDTTADGVIVTVIGNDFRPMEELQFLHTFLIHRAEILLMGSA